MTEFEWRFGKAHYYGVDSTGDDAQQDVAKDGTNDEPDGKGHPELSITIYTPQERGVDCDHQDTHEATERTHDEGHPA